MRTTTLPKLGALLFPLVLALAGCPNDTSPNPEPAPNCVGWTQWGQSATHAGNACNTAQPLNRVLAQVTFDPFVAKEQGEGGGDLYAHYPSPLIDGDDVYMMAKTGQYISCEPPGTGMLADGGTYCGAAAWDQQVWSYKAFRWTDGGLAEQWTFQSDWKPPTAALTSWEPAFQGAIAGNVLYVPGARGTVHAVDRHTGAQLALVDPFPAADPDLHVAGGISVGPNGNAFYNVLKVDPSDPWGNDADGWLVEIYPDAGTQVANYAQLTLGQAPDAGDLCGGVFRAPAFTRPFPPPDDGGAPVYPPAVTCGTQRPSLNVVPAVGPDGTIYTVSRSHFVARQSYLLAVNPDLSLKWMAPLQNILDDGCGVTIPSDSPADGGFPSFHCRVGAATGVDPLTNQPPAAWADDSSSSSPVVLPDGSVLYGGLTTYNTSRGHLFKFSSTGAPLATFDFGWDLTPAYDVHDGTYSVLLKDNHYFNWDASPSKFFITRLNADLAPEWSFQSTNTLSCTRLADGGQDCVDDGQHPDGFEWCINAPAVDRAGDVLVNSEDGHLYEIDRSGNLVGSILLKQALGAAYTPLAVDSSGRVYSLNGGDLFVVGQ